MGNLETTLWELFLRGDSRISVLESFQNDPHTYVKVFVDDGTHGITVQEVTSYPYSFCNNEGAALKFTIRKALEKVADIIRARAYILIEAKLVAEFS